MSSLSINSTAFSTGILSSFRLRVLRRSVGDKASTPKSANGAGNVKVRKYARAGLCA